MDVVLDALVDAGGGGEGRRKKGKRSLELLEIMFAKKSFGQEVKKVEESKGEFLSPRSIQQFAGCKLVWAGQVIYFTCAVATLQIAAANAAMCLRQMKGGERPVG